MLGRVVLGFYWFLIEICQLIGILCVVKLLFCGCLTRACVEQ